MARPPRNVLPDYGFFHVTTRGVARSNIFLDVADRRLWNTLLATTTRRFGWICHVYCQMTNHFHLVVEGERERVSRAMHLLNGLYAQAFNRRYERAGHLFQNRFSTRVIEDETYLYDACDYVLMNPVRAELVDRPEDWRWSGGDAARGILAS